MTDKLTVIQETKPWYRQGLRFKCTECGQCCTGSPGYTWVSPNEIQAIASYLKLSIEEFGQRYLRQVGERFALKEHFKTYACTFLKDNRCTIYPVRPKQCRTFPWWKENLESEESWQAAARRCEGIDDTAPLIPLETIQDNLHA